MYMTEGKMYLRDRKSMLFYHYYEQFMYFLRKNAVEPIENGKFAM